MPISAALSELSHFSNQHSDKPKYSKVRGKRVTFGNVLLREAFKRVGKFAHGNYGMFTMSERADERYARACQ